MTDTTQHAYAPGAGHTGRCSVCSNVELHAFHQPAVASYPAAVDLGNLYAKAGWLNPVEKRLVAAVEALRERVAELETSSTFLGDMRKAQRQLVEALKRADATEAHAVELTVAVETAQSFGCPVCQGDCSSANPPVTNCPMQQYSAALAATPAEALERARQAAKIKTTLLDLVQVLLDNDPDDDAADGVTVLAVWRKEGRAVLKANATLDALLPAKESTP